ncbi:MAG TPA: haloacid dehalogenase [Anaerolineae bacterium]|nr:haloacid dehalogenase [Anaerolineae bacterium]HCM97286.1 haloacid dehalogenase [Anaerolineae bacterium]
MMDKLEQIAEQIRQTFDTQTAARDQALTQARMLTRHCSLAIRAVHREETDLMQSHLDEAGKLAACLTTDLEQFPNLYHTGYTQDALKEYAEAQITCALILNRPLPSPHEIHVIGATYLKGLSEVVGELRRRCLDILRQGYSDEAERLLKSMDDIFAVLVTMDYPDAITNGLRRQTDIARSIIERTRGDLTFSLRGEHLAQAIAGLSKQLLSGELLPGDLAGNAYLPDEEGGPDE